MKQHEPRGTWGVRILIRLFTVVLAVLFYWLLGFLVEDIESIPGPDLAEIERQYVDQGLVRGKQSLDTQIADLNRQITNKLEEQRLVGDSSQNLQRTINQLLELQKLSIQKDVSLPESEKGNLSTSLASFLESQKAYQSLNENVARLTSTRLDLEKTRENLEHAILKQAAPAADEFERQNESHRLRLAFYQLLILVPLLGAAGFLLVRRRSSLYYPLFLAFGAATLIKVGLVIHEYFPSRYFKYILIGGLLLVVARLLVHLIRTVAFPKTEWLLRQYREAYERFLCPECDYPIRIGPRKFLYWTRRTVNKILPRASVAEQDEPYTCPACGTLLFGECAACHKIRHVLLEHCQHCGAKGGAIPLAGSG